MTEKKDNVFVDKYLTPVAVLLGAIILALAFAFGNPSRPATTGDSGAAVADIKDVKTNASPVVGLPSAPVTIAVWYDYQCPFCKRFDQDALVQTYEEYVKTGKVKIVFKDFQFLGQDSIDAALFSRAMYAAYPDRFYEWYQAVMDAQDEENGGFGDLASVKALAATLPGIDANRVEKLMNDNKDAYQAAIDADRAEGQTFGITGTPGAIIGTTVIAGAQPYSKVKSLIDAELQK